MISVLQGNSNPKTEEIQNSSWKNHKIYHYIYLEQLAKVKLNLHEEQDGDLTKIEDQIKRLEDESELPILLFSASRRREKEASDYEHQLIYYLPDLEIVKDDRVHGGRECESFFRKDTLDLRPAFINFGFPKDSTDPLNVKEGLFNYSVSENTRLNLREVLNKQYIVGETTSSLRAVISHLFAHERAITSWNFLRERLSAYYLPFSTP